MSNEFLYLSQFLVSWDSSLDSCDRVKYFDIATDKDIVTFKIWSFAFIR